MYASIEGTFSACHTPLTPFLMVTKSAWALGRRLGISSAQPQTPKLSDELITEPDGLA